MTSGVLVAAAALVGVGAVGASSRSTFRAGLATQAAGATVVGVFGFWALATGKSVGLPFTSSFVLSFGVDGLTAFFLGVLGLVAAPVLVFAMRYLEPSARGRAIGVLTGVFLLVLVEVLCARDPLTFLAGWELMTLLPAAMILVRSADRSSRRRLRLSRDHASGRCGHLDRCSAPGPGGRDRRHGGGAGLGPAGGSRWRRLSAWVQRRG